MTDFPAHPMESAIVEALTQGLDRLPVSLPPTREVLAAGAKAGAAAPSDAAMAGVAQFVPDAAERGSGRGFLGFLAHRWPYVAGAVLLVVAMVCIAAGLQYHGNPAGSASTNPSPVTTPSGGGSKAVGGVPSSTPEPTATPTAVATATPPPAATPTPPGTPIPATRRPSTPIATPPAPPSTAAPAPAPVAASTPPATHAPTAAPTATPTPRPTRPPCPIQVGPVCV